MMARQEGLMHFVGRIGDLVYYKRGDQYLVRRAGQPSKEALKSGANYEKTRNWNKEFGGAAAMSKAFRMQFAAAISRFADKMLAGRLTGVFRTLIGQGAGQEGARVASIREHGQLLVGFQFRKEEVFEYVFQVPLAWHLDAERHRLTLTIPAFDPQVRLPKVKATHCQLTVAAGRFSDYAVDAQKGSYAPVEEHLGTSVSVVTSDVISLAASCEGFCMTADLDNSSSKAAVIAVVGLVFYKEEEGMMHELGSRRCMKVGFVG